ncbi:MAG: PKD domain-containing protein, partial [Flavobacteriales bacterium]|nr:PKD domain-containing protein [Flavobacteriales bacterium]
MKKLLLTASAALTILFAQAQQCQADFSYMQNGPTTIFTDLSTVNPSWSTNYSVTWDWDLGDGNASTQQNPVHTYANNGIYTPCLTVTYFDSTIINWCTSVYCDSILIGNSIPASWDCNPATGCYDPGTGLGQYTSLSACQAVCGTPTPSWDCPTNTPGGCYDPGTGNGQYSSLAACQAVCGTPTPSWDCGLFGCSDPGTGMGQYTTLAACQAICVSTVSNACDYMTLVSTGGSPQTILMAQVPNINTIIDYWITTAP